MDGTVTVHKPPGESETVRLTASGDQSRWTFSETGQSGIYGAELPEPAAAAGNCSP